MISDSNLKDITPKPKTGTATATQVAVGTPIPKPVRVRSFSPEEWEEFVEEWADSLKTVYAKVRRFGGAGDFGIDVAGFVDGGLKGTWDNYQCKRFAHPMMPSEAWLEIGKIIYYSHTGEFAVPRKHYFVCSQDIGTTLEQYLNDPAKLKAECRKNWAKSCENKITSATVVTLKGELLKYFDAFDFSIFSSKSVVELIDAHSKTKFHSVRFGGGLPERPTVDAPPPELALTESRYIRQLLDAYGDHAGSNFATPSDLTPHTTLNENFSRQRERFYNAEALRNFARDTVPEGTFAALQDEVYHGVVDVCDSTHSNGFERMKATTNQSAQLALTANPLSPVTKTQDRQGICHQLANDDRLIWVKK